MTRVVYLHGFASSPQSNKAQFFRRRFAERGVEIAIPQLDEGRFEQTNVSRQLEVIEREAAGQPVILMGSSLGGYLAAVYASRHPEVEKLVLMAPALTFAAHFPKRFTPAQVDQWKREGSLPFFHYGEKREARLGYGFLEDALSSPSDPDFQQSALILHGTADDVVPAAVSERFAANRPNVSLRLLASGHELTDVLEVLWNETATFLGFQNL
jgi:pimeloyl-ACP methyl ester carboxylesterase